MDAEETAPQHGNPLRACGVLLLQLAGQSKLSSDSWLA